MHNLVLSTFLDNKQAQKVNFESVVTEGIKTQ